MAKPNNYQAFITGDPVYAQAKLQGRRDLVSSLATAFQRQQEYLQELGSVDVARGVYRNNPYAMRKFGPDEKRPGFLGGKIIKQMTSAEKNSLKAIGKAADPTSGTSALAKIAYAYNENVKLANESLNNQGLFYSGHRVDTLNKLTRDKQFQQSDAMFQARQQLNAVIDYVMNARRDYRTRMQAAAEAAYNRAMAQSIVSG